MKLIAYIRVSSTKASDHEPSAKEQLSKIRAWAKSNGHVIAEVLKDEGVSGTNGADDREALSAALAALHDGMAVAHLDRLSRALTVQEAVLAQAWAAGGSVFSADGGEVLRDDPDDPYRTAMRQRAGVFAQLERGMVVARLRRGKRAARARGRYVGGYVPLGSKVEGGMLVSDDASQGTVSRMRELRASGKSLRQVGAMLTAEGYETARGGSWQASTVRRVLARSGE